MARQSRDQNVKLRAKAKSWAKRSLLASRALGLARHLHRPAVAIVMYHSVMPEPQEHASTLGDIIHAADIFRSQMEVLARGYNPVSLDDVGLFVEGKKSLRGKPVVVTFDDGYADNAEVAAPILNQFGIPGVFYLTVGSIDRAILPWVARLRHAFCATHKGTWKEAAGNSFDLRNESSRERAFTAALQHCACLTGEAQDAFVDSVERELEVPAIPDQNRLMMSWEQARKLRTQGHTMGSHTVSHPNLAHVKGSSELQCELAHSKQRLESELACSITHFSYPCPILQPHWSPRTVQICRQLGYRTAVTTNSGPVSRGDDLLTLRRIPPTAQVEGLRWNLECTFLGRSM